MRYPRGTSRGQFMLSQLVLRIGGIALLSLLLASCKGSLDIWAPDISLEQDRPVGLAPTIVYVNALDSSGVKSLIVKQGDPTTGTVVLSKVYSPPLAAISEELFLSAAVDPSVKNRIDLHVTASDESNHSTTVHFAVPYSDKVPEVSIVSAPRSLAVGEPAVAILQVKGESIESAGIMVGTTLIPGTSLRTLSMGGASDLFLTLFSVASESEGASVRAYSRNQAFNTNSIPLPISVRREAASTKRIKMKEEEVSEMIVASRIAFGKEMSFFTPSISLSGFNLPSQTTASTFFGPILEMSREFLLRLVRKVGAVGYPAIPFAEPSGSLAAPFGSRVSISVNDNELSLGNFPFEVRETSSVTIESMGEGTVLFNENLGPLGNVLGIDEGLGLVLVYGFLDSSEVLVGSKVMARAVVGLPHRKAGGSSGTYFLGAFLRGTPVNPAFLYDKNWFRSNLGRYMDS